MRRVGVLVGLVVVVLAALAGRGALGPWDPGRSRIDVLLAGATAGLVVFGLLALVPPRWARVVAAVGVAAALALTGFALLETLATGLPGPAAGLLAVGAVTLALSTLARARRPGRLPWERPVAAASFALVVAAVAVVAAVLAVDVPVRAIVAAPGGPPGTLAAGTSGAILWRSPSYPEVRDVRAAGAGVVVAGRDDVRLLDGATGGTRWSHHRTGAQLDRVAVTPDRTAVVAIFRPGTVTGPGLVVVLDADTGARRWESWLAENASVALTDTVVVATEPQPTPARDRLVARDLASGAVDWTWDPPPGCRTEMISDRVARGAVPVEYLCPSGDVLGGTLLGLDPGTGQPLWTLDTGSRSTSDGELLGPRLLGSTADGALVVVGSARGALVVDPASGREIRALDPRSSPRLDADGRLLVRDDAGPVAALDPDGAPVPLPAPCPDELATTVTATGVLSLCRTGDDVGLQVHGGAVRSLDLAASPDPGVRERPAFVVPAVGGVVVGVAGSESALVGLASDG